MVGVGGIDEEVMLRFLSEKQGKKIRKKKKKKKGRRNKKEIERMRSM